MFWCQGKLVAVAERSPGEGQHTMELGAGELGSSKWGFGLLPLWQRAKLQLRGF